MHAMIGPSRPAALGPTLRGTYLRRHAAALHEAALNQELTSMQIAAHRLGAFARAHRLGAVAWHAAAIAAMCASAPDALPRFAELLEGLEIAVGSALAHGKDLR